MPRVTAADLIRRDELLAAIAIRRREANTMAGEVREIEDTAAADLAASGRESIRRGGRVITTADGRISIPWKKEFVAAMGAEAAAAVEAAAEPKPKLVIGPPPNPKNSAEAQ